MFGDLVIINFHIFPLLVTFYVVVWMICGRVAAANEFVELFLLFIRFHKGKIYAR